MLGTLTFVFYVSDASNEYVEICTFFGSLTQQLDVAINIFFLLYFIVRVSLQSTSLFIHQKKNTSKSVPQFLAASDKLLFMVEAKSFVDFFTIPPFSASMYLHRTWIGKNAMDCWNKQNFI